MRFPRSLVPVAALAALALATSLAPPVVAEPPAAPAPAAEEGGKALPAGAWKITFPFMAKQSISFVSDADAERMVGVVSFANPGTDPLGTVDLDEQGTGTGSFKVPVTALTTGHEGRDEHLRSATWLDVEKCPDVSFAITKIERVKPTVYRVSGTWTMHGVSKAVTTTANVRFVDKMDHVDAPSGIARLKAKLSLALKDFGVDNPYVGSPSVAASWDVEMVLLGMLAPRK